MKELIRVERYNFKEDWTISRLYFLDRLVGYAVEDELREIKIHGETAIPEGFYPLDMRYSPKFSGQFRWSEEKQILLDYREARDIRKFPPQEYLFENHQLIWIKEVPDFQYILMHWGNTDLDTDGCLVVGSHLGVVKGREAVLNSRRFYSGLYPKIMPLIRQGGWGIRYINVNPPLTHNENIS